MSAMLQQLPLLLFPLLVTLGAAYDALTMTIPNRLALALAGGFLVLAPFAGIGWTDVALHGAAAAIVLAVGFAMFARGWIGAGDAKFAAAIVLWLGWSHMAGMAVAAALFGGVLAVAVLVWRRAVGPVAVPRWPARFFWIQKSDAGIPVGVALAAAALLVYPHSAWMTSATG